MFPDNSYKHKKAITAANLLAAYETLLQNTEMAKQVKHFQILHYVFLYDIR